MRGMADPRGRGISMGGGAPPPEDVLILIGVVFTTFVLQFFSVTAFIPGILRLGPLVYRGAIWQTVTYAFIGFGPASLWFLLSLLILFWFAGTVFRRLGRRRFWTLILQVTLFAAVVAVLVRGAGMLMGLSSPAAFLLMQGQYMLVTVMIAAYASLYGNATILLFFVIPIRARWFLALEVLFAFMGFLSTRDFAGFMGLCTAVGLTWALLEPGGPRRGLRDARLRLRQMITEQRLARMRRKRKFDVIDGGKDDFIN